MGSAARRRATRQPPPGFSVVCPCLVPKDASAKTTPCEPRSRVTDLPNCGQPWQELGESGKPPARAVAQMTVAQTCPRSGVEFRVQPWPRKFCKAPQHSLQPRTSRRSRWWTRLRHRSLPARQPGGPHHGQRSRHLLDVRRLPRRIGRGSGPSDGPGQHGSTLGHAVAAGVGAGAPATDHGQPRRRCPCARGAPRKGRTRAPVTVYLVVLDRRQRLRSCSAWIGKRSRWIGDLSAAHR